MELHSLLYRSPANHPTNCLLLTPNIEPRAPAAISTPQFLCSHAYLSRLTLFPNQRFGFLAAQFSGHRCESMGVPISSDPLLLSAAQLGRPQHLKSSVLLVFSQILVMSSWNFSLPLKSLSVRGLSDAVELALFNPATVFHNLSMVVVSVHDWVSTSVWH